MNLVLDAVIRSSVVLTIGLAAVWLLKKQPAALRHWVVAAALALAATQPMISRVIPALQVPVIKWATEETRAEEATVETNIVVEPNTTHVPASPVATTNWPRIAFVVWAGGAVVSLAVLFVGALWLSWLGSRSTAANDQWGESLKSICAELGFERRVRILVTSHPALLVTWGAFAPVILLPADARSWSSERIRLVLAHEVAHLVRRDWTIQLGAEIVRAINWFNPLFWFACRTLRSESEHACDDIVLDLGIGGTSYASHLIDLARTFSVHGRTWLPAPSIARPSTLERRVRAMLNPQVDRRPVSMLRRALLAAVLMAIALPIAAASQAVSTPAGSVVDPTGRPLVDAVLRLTPLGKNEQVFETRTDASGAFEFAPVPTGEYMLAISYPGFSGSRQRIPLSGGGTTISLRARVGTLQETISVTGGGIGSDTPRYEERAAAPTQSGCTASTVGGQITPPMKTRDVRPRYRREWVAARLEGVILMQARIGADGKVKNVDVISPVNADLEDEAMAAVSQWEFSPTYLNCEPIEVEMYVTVQFKAEL
jgi:TonB family protein